VIRLLGRITSQPASHALECARSHPSQRVREAAAEALAFRAGLDDPFKSAWATLDSGGWQALSTPQRLALAVRILVDEVCNGGFLQYFVNTSGDHWRDAREGLAAIGAASDCKLLDQVAARFGPHQPSVDRDQRHRQLARIARRSDRPFEAMEKEFYADQQDREVLLLRYIEQHAEAFR
jgi:hypothetical protein